MDKAKRRRIAGTAAVSAAALGSLLGAAAPAKASHQGRPLVTHVAPGQTCHKFPALRAMFEGPSAQGQCAKFVAQGGLGTLSPEDFLKIKFGDILVS